MFARIQGKNILSHVHGSEVEIEITRIRSYLREGLFDLGLRVVNKFIAVSDFTSSKLILRGAKESKVETVHNGVEFERFHNSSAINRKEIEVPEDKFLLITVSRLEPKKSQDLVMHAIKNLDDIHYLIVGTGDEREYLEEKMKELDISEKISFAGYVEDDKLPSYYKASDLYVMPSRYIKETGNVESWGISFLEANAAGKAVIGANNGGMPESIKDGETGFLAETNTDDVREKIVRLQEDDELRYEMEDNAVDWAREHDWPKVVSKIDKIIEDSI
jgi:phosphatidylinositol alpha-1,6-mannosyltransferase